MKQKNSTLFLIGILLISFCHTTLAQKKVYKSNTKKIETKAEFTVPNTNEKYVEITTPYGVMIAKLYNSTPLHRDNFLKLVNAGFYDSLLFHRVINGFMIQGGDPNSKNADSNKMLGDGNAPGKNIPAEFANNFFHKKGALAAARDENPAKESSNCQFYIVQGKRIDTAQMKQMSANVAKNNPAFSYSDSQLETYNRLGGTPFLDQNYTVFGEVISGLDILDKIATTPTKQNDRPKQNIWMKMKVLK